MKKFISVLRTPDNAFGATESTCYRFEEPATAACDVKYDYVVSQHSAKVVVYPSGSPVKYLKLRFRGDFSCVDKVYGDQWERSSEGAYLEWRSVMPSRALPWFCFVKQGERIACYGVKTGADCFAFWQVDAHGVTLFMNLCSGNEGTDLKSPITACEVVELFGNEGEDPYKLAKRFSAMLCDSPVLPNEPIFGVNNWYWAYGHISKDTISTETDYLLEMCDGTKHRPYMIIDDGWQLNRTYDKGAYIGGPWTANDRFGSMADTADMIHRKGAKAGIWFRPLLTLGNIPEAAKLTTASGGIILDPSHPYTLERVFSDASTIRSWGYDLIKHDFTTIDITGISPLTSERQTALMCHTDRRFYDNTSTTATIIKNLYKTVQNAVGTTDVIGCNTVGHLTAGIHSTYRVGNDTSGRSFEWSRRLGVNSVMRLPQNDTFYRADPDCAAFTERVDHDINLDYLEMCAITGMTTLASVTPGILTPERMKRINEIYRMADEDTRRFGIAHYTDNANPEIFVSEDGSTTRSFDWTRAYDGARTVLDWFN